MPRKKTTAKPKMAVAVASDPGQRNVAPRIMDAGSLTPIVAEIKHWHRQRVFAMDQRKRSDQALGAFLRTQLGCARALPKAAAETIAKRATALIALGEKVAKGKATGIDEPVFGQWATVILASIQGRSHWDAIEATATKEMERLGASLPVWTSFGEAIKGFGPRSLAVIVGESGDLSLYANPAKLWKRMGLAVMDGVRQGGLRKTASKEDWIAHGYNAKRRSFMFVIGDVLVKNQGAYRDLYLERKEFERAKAKAAGLKVAPAAKIPAKRKDEFMSDGHVHRRAQRYMEKRLLKHLWQAWRRALPESMPIVDVPAMRSATPTAQTGNSVPSAKSKRQTIVPRSTSDRLSAARSASVEPPANPAVPSASPPAKAGKRRASVAKKTVTTLPGAKVQAMS